MSDGENPRGGVGVVVLVVIALMAVAFYAGWRP